MKLPHDPVDAAELAEVKRQLDLSENGVVVVFIRPQTPGAELLRGHAHEIARRTYERTRKHVKAWGHNPDRVCVRVMLKKVDDAALGGRLGYLIGE
jgi:hypothetical protein